MSDDDRRKAWFRQADQIRFRLNLAWWLDRLAPWLIGTSLVAALLIVLGRTLRWELTPAMLIGGAVVWVAILSALAWWQARQRFVDRQQALVSLEDDLRLNNALSTARAGRLAWPELPAFAARESRFHWRWSRVFAPALVAMAVVTAASLVPVVSLSGKETAPPAEPLAWKQMDDWIETLEEEEFVEEEALAEIEEKIEALRDQPEENWFSHSSMEASDSLREALARDIRNLSQELEQAERNLSNLEKHGQAMSSDARSEQVNEYEKAIQGLKSGGLKPNENLMKMMESLDPSQLAEGNLSNLSEEQMQQLREQLEKGAQACKECQGSGAGQQGLPSLSESEELTSILNQDGDERKGGGRGGIQRGRGDAPIFYGDEKNLNSGTLEPVQNPDFRRAAPGDVVGEGLADHNVDETKTAPQAGGAIQSPGQGGDAVWKESLAPQEKAILKRYFD